MCDVLRGSWWALLLAALGSLGGCGSTHVGQGNGSSETHFLTRCTDRCGGGLSCVCGVCTETCTSDAVCASLADGATCSTAEAAQCGGEEAAQACDLQCERDADCSALGAEHRCEAGVCRAPAASSSGGDREGTLPADGPACVASQVVAEISVTNIDRVDLLFVVDNSESMAEEQASLREQFPKLIRELTTGTRADGTTFPVAKDLHLGVVSSNMGDLGAGVLPECAGLGDDGIMLNAPNPELSGCAPSYPRFLSYLVDVSDPVQTTTDFGCIATLGTSGCGFEQPLEAGLKALWPSIDVDPLTGDVHDPNRITYLGDGTGAGELGHGDVENAGFLRNDPAQGLSAIAIVVVTDEDDCSTGSRELFAAPEDLDPGDPRADQPLNLRCFHNPQDLYVVERYINGFKALRAGNENLVMFAAIAGVPADLTEPEDYAAVDWHNDAERTLFYDRLIGDQRMEEVLDPSSLPDGDAQLRPSCVSEGRGRAYPPRRIVQVAREFGANGSVYSICQDDFGPAIDGIVGLIATQLGAVCLPRPLVRDYEGLVSGCEVVWELPPPALARPGTPTACGAPRYDFLLERERGPRVDARGGAICRVAQLAVQQSGTSLQPIPTGEGTIFTNGWYYDDFSEDVRNGCAGTPKQRIAFTDLATPPTGVTVKLECVNETYPVSIDRSDLDPRLEQPAPGDPCHMVIRNGQTLAGDRACELRLANGDTDTSMYCHPELNVCVRECETTADCPDEWVCSESPAAVTDSRDGRICVAPLCSAGPLSATSERVGDACQPDRVPEGGFSDSETYLGTADADCGGGVCMVFRLRGDPREDCVPSDPDPGSLDPGTICASEREVADHVYCTCRCDAPDGYAQCACPDGFSCVDVIDQGGDDIRGGYCARNGTFTR